MNCSYDKFISLDLESFRFRPKTLRKVTYFLIRRLFTPSTFKLGHLISSLVQVKEMLFLTKPLFLITQKPGVEFNLRLLANDLNNCDKQPPFSWVSLAQKLKLSADEIDAIRHSSSGSPSLLSASHANLTHDMLTYWTNKYNKYESVDFNLPEHASGEVLLKAMRELQVDEDIIQRNLSATSTNVGAESALSVEKSLAKLNLNLHELLDAKKEDATTTVTTTRTIVQHEDRDLIKVCCFLAFVLNGTNAKK